MKAFLALILLWPQEPDPFHGLWKKVDLDLKEVGTHAAFEELFKQAGSTLTLPQNLTERKITYRASGVPFWQAVDDLCRLNGGLRHPKHPFKEERVLHALPWVEYPAVYQGPLRLSVFDAARIREVRYPGRADRTDLTLVLQWAAPVEPIREWLGKAGDLRLLRVEDDTGRSLLPEIKVSIEFEFGNMGWGSTPACFWIRHLQPAAAGAKKVARIDAEWEGTILRDIEEVVFENPAESVGTAKKIGPMTLALKSFSKEKDALASDDYLSYDFVLRLSFEPSSTPKDWQESLKTMPLRRRALATFQSVILSDGQVHRIKTQSLSEGKTQEDAVELGGNVSLAADHRLASIAVRVAKGGGSVKTAFSFKDVRLPEEGR